MSVATAPSAGRSTGEARVRTPRAWVTWMLAAVVVAATLYGLLGDIYRETPARELLGATLRGRTC